MKNTFLTLGIFTRHLPAEGNYSFPSRERFFENLSPSKKEKGRNYTFLQWNKKNQYSKKNQFQSRDNLSKKKEYQELK